MNMETMGTIIGVKKFSIAYSNPQKDEICVWYNKKYDIFMMYIYIYVIKNICIDFK